MPDSTAATPAWHGDVHAGVAAWLGEAGPPPDFASTADAMPPEDLEALGPEADHEAVARKILLDALTGQARSRAELQKKLDAKEVPRAIATQLLDRFEEVGLIDDAAFARMWIASRQPGKGLASRALAQELRRKGIHDVVAREALDEIDPDEERDVARLLVQRKLRSMRSLDPQVATRRLVGMLARKGHSPGLAYAVVREELGAVAEETETLGQPPRRALRDDL